jgi:hypothetical protein
VPALWTRLQSRRDARLAWYTPALARSLTIVVYPMGGNTALSGQVIPFGCNRARRLK